MTLALVGQKVQVHLKDGVVYEGILHTMKCDTAKDFDVVLLMAEKIKEGPNATLSEMVERPEPKVLLRADQVVQVTAKAVKTDAASVGVLSAGAKEHEDAGGFGTDSSISRGKATGYGRQLEKWTPSEEDMSISGNGDQGGQGGGGPQTAGVSFAYKGDGAKDWDQFAAFERMTGARTTYTEEQYTTQLNKNDPRMKALEAQAERIAREIEGQTSSNVHVAEERGHYIDDSGMDEEDKYSGVIRGGTSKPPQVKQQEPKQQQQQKPPAAPTPASTTTSKLKAPAAEKGLNVNAKEFVPGRRSAGASAGAAAGAVAQGAGPSGFVSPMYRPQMMGSYMPQMMQGNQYQMYAAGQFYYQQQQQQQQQNQYNQ